MRVASANVFCLNPRPRKALRAVAAQEADVTLVIESVGRFDRHAERWLPERRLRGYTRPDGMPVALHAGPRVEVTDAREDGRGWLEARVNGLRLFVVHAVAPYLPWRWPRRARQLDDLARRMNDVGEGEPALVIGDFNTADFEPVWARYEANAEPWKRIDCALHGAGPGPARRSQPRARDPRADRRRPDRPHLRRAVERSPRADGGPAGGFARPRGADVGRLLAAAASPITRRMQASAR